jgi:hypothetical protein
MDGQEKVDLGKEVTCCMRCQVHPDEVQETGESMETRLKTIWGWQWKVCYAKNCLFLLPQSPSYSTLSPSLLVAQALLEGAFLDSYL